MPEIKSFYVIRVDPGAALGLEPFGDSELCAYVSAVHFGSSSCGVDCSASQNIALKFGSFIEAALVMAFIIFFVEESYEDALEIVLVDS